MPSPSDNLINLLTDLQLCLPRDIKACESLVKRLYRDLPDFDSVWLDAMVQRRLLTPWQATILQSDRPRQLRQHEYCLLEPLGRDTYLARRTSDDSLVAMRRVSNPQPDGTERHHQWLEDLLEGLNAQRRSAPVSLALPTDVLPDDAKPELLWLVSPYVTGWRLDELLVRGGRMPWPVVAEVGRDLLRAMHWLETQRLVHGEVSLRNIRLRPDGRAVLVDPFVSRLLRPTVSFRADLKLRDVEFTAPELGGTARQPDSRSELYSVGCVLWQLLTARPVFLSADPLTKLLKSQEHDVTDVRSLVPDCPDVIARQVQNLTRRSRELRPATAAEAADDWSQCCGRGTANTRTLLRRLPDRFQRPASPTARLRAARRGKLTATVTTTACLTLAVFVGLDRGLIPSTLRLGPHTTSETTTLLPQPVVTAAVHAEDTSHSDAEAATAVDRVRPLPMPGADGVIRLKGGETYQAVPVNVSGALRIECPGGPQAVVVIAQSMPWNLTATDVALRNVDLRRDGTSSPEQSSRKNDSPLLTVVCDVFELERCLLHGENAQTCVTWQPATDGVTAVAMSNSVFEGAGRGMDFRNPADHCSLNNVLLKTNATPIRCTVADDEPTTVTLELTRVTQVDGDSFLDVVLPSDAAAPDVALQLTSGESVLAPAIGLIRFGSFAPDWSQERLHVEFRLRERGNPTIVPGSVHPAVYFDRSLQSTVELNEQQTVIESLLFADPVFRGRTAAGESASQFMEFELLDYEGPKLSSVNLPGIEARRLP